MKLGTSCVRYGRLASRPYRTESALIRLTVQPFTESYDTRWCNDKICPPEDEHGTARNMSRIVM
jgi:hypothetical protein